MMDESTPDFGRECFSFPFCFVNIAHGITYIFSQLRLVHDCNITLLVTLILIMHVTLVPIYFISFTFQREDGREGSIVVQSNHHSGGKAIPEARAHSTLSDG